MERRMSEPGKFMSFEIDQGELRKEVASRQLSASSLGVNTVKMWSCLPFSFHQLSVESKIVAPPGAAGGW